ncbi:hypothetical protein NPIL_528071 [Nephila pilipes]|uniref:Uncharacterized protein n=1 Tax=Nephila pilipes TaxID=299642 RepID=A0A8X6MM89_NEPPI|nr:hypothetical protein NPIL_62911 [Nephila pilipes]GFU31738.1 hypothetical protein NPIL_528071 [Nephila pilipes]
MEPQFIPSFPASKGVDKRLGDVRSQMLPGCRAAKFAAVCFSPSPPWPPLSPYRESHLRPCDVLKKMRRGLETSEISGLVGLRKRELTTYIVR